MVFCSSRRNAAQRQIANKFAATRVQNSRFLYVAMVNYVNSQRIISHQNTVTSWKAIPEGSIADIYNLLTKPTQKQMNYLKQNKPHHYYAREIDGNAEKPMEKQDKITQKMDMRVANHQILQTS